MINLPGEDFALFKAPYPECQGSIQGEVNKNGPERPIFSLVPSQSVISVKGDRSNSYSRVTQRQPHIREKVGLLELQRRKIIGEGIVCGVLKICSGYVAVEATGHKGPTWDRVHTYLRHRHFRRRMGSGEQSWIVVAQSK